MFPTRERPLKPYEAVVRATAVTRPLVAALRPDAVVADILTLGAGARRRARGRAGGHPDPACDPRTERGWPPFSIGARLPRTRAGAGCGAALTRLTARARARPPRAQRDAPPARPRAAGLRPRRDLALAGAGGDLPGSSSTRVPLALPATHIVGPLMWEPPAGDVALPPGSEPARAGRALDLAGPGAPAAARRRCAGWPARPCACSRRGTASRLASRSDVPAEHAPGRLGLLRARHAPVRRRRVPRRPRHAGAGAGQRLRGRRRPGRAAT